MRKLLCIISFMFILTGCDLAYNQEMDQKLNQEQLNVIKNEVYNDLKSSIEDVQYDEIKAEIYNDIRKQIEDEFIEQIKLDIYNELNLLLDQQQIKNELIISDLNQKIDEIMTSYTNDEINYDQMKQELEGYVSDSVNTLSNEIKQDLVNEINLNTQTSSNELKNIESLIIDVVNKNTKAVLGVSNYQLVSGSLRQTSTGSGVIYKKINNDYYLVTNEHVVRDAKKLKVVLENNISVDAILLGSDEKTDLAVVKFTTSYTLPVSTFADSNLLTRGQIAIAIGSPLGYEYYGTVTMGVISGLGRIVPIDFNEDGITDWTQTLLQHDVAINPGNSGGPLYNINGEIIGINNMKSIEINVDNIGFAIPSNIVIEIINNLE